MDAIFSKTTLNRYYHKGVEAIFDCFDTTLRGEIHKSNYLMVDETCEFVVVMNNGLWTHTRRLYVESLISDRVDSMAMIEAIAHLFDIEFYCRLLDMSDDDRKLERQK